MQIIALFVKIYLSDWLNHLTSVKLDKSNQLTSNVFLQILHTHSTH